MNIRIFKALKIAYDYGQTDGARHKTWVIDGMVRALCGSEEEYLNFKKDFEKGEDGVKTYEWDTGIAP